MDSINKNWFTVRTLHVIKSLKGLQYDQNKQARPENRQNYVMRHSVCDHSDIRCRRDTKQFVRW